MTRRKRKLEQIEALGNSEMINPLGLSDEDRKYVCDLIRRKLAEAQAKPKVESSEKALQALRHTIENEKNDDRRLIHERIYGIASKLKNHIDSPPLPLVLENDNPNLVPPDTNSDAGSELPLHEMIKQQRRERLN